MSTFSLSKEEQGIVVFHVWKSLPYKIRLFLSFFLIVVGLIIQFSGAFILGLIFIIAGNLLLLVKGYDNRIKLKSYNASGEWVKTDKEHIDEIVVMNKKLEKWDRSPFDISSQGGRAIFIFFLFILFLLFMILSDNTLYQIIVFDAAVLFIPHWFSGLKRITTTPLLLRKIGIYNKVLKEFAEQLEDKNISFMIYVKGDEKKLPDDLKMKIEFAHQPDNFMGMYVQISLNNVQGKYYPYFYVVLVAKDSLFMNDKYFDRLKLPLPLIKERSKENSTDILVIRQHTTRTSGYHTKIKTIYRIFEHGLKAAESIVKHESSPVNGAG